jgi:Family of unknown function (DUF6252)
MLFSILLGGTLACNKDKGSNGSWSFTWTHENISYSATSADAYVRQAGLGLGPNQILAFVSTSSPYARLSLKLSSLNPNSYAVSPVSNQVNYIDDSGNNLLGANGNVTISSNSSNRLSGNFSVKLVNASSDTTEMIGSFTSVKLHP